MPETADRLRHLIEWNCADLDQLVFFWRDCARQSRILTILEYGCGSFQTGWQFPASLPMTSPVPAAAQLGLGDEAATRFATALKVLLEGARPMLALMAGHIVNPQRWSALFAQAVPDILWAQTTPAHLPVGLSPVTPLADMSVWGIPRGGWFANAAAAHTLNRASLAFESRLRDRAAVTDHVYDAADLIRIAGFYPIEREGAHAWCWTGPDPQSVLLMPSHGGADILLTLYLFGSKLSLDAAHIRVVIDGLAWPTQFVQDELKIEVRFRAVGSRACHRVELIQRDLWHTPDGSRQIGVALHKLRLTVLS